MTDIHPVTRERHGDRAWNKAPGFRWASHERAVVIAHQEAMQLMMTLPLSFLRVDEQYQLIVLLGLRPGENLMVAADGRWLGPRIPVALQHYPFRRVRTTDGQQLLGVDEAGLLAPGVAGGAAMFNGDTPTAELTTILEQLVQGENQRQQTRQVVAVLDQHGLLEPWDLQIQGEDRLRKVEGLYRVNEKRLNEMPAETLQALRDCGALVLAYCQLLSMQHIQQLGSLSAARQRAEQALAADHGIISFANL